MMTQNVNANDVFGFSKKEMIGEIRQIGASQSVRHRMKARRSLFDHGYKGARLVEKAIGKSNPSRVLIILQNLSEVPLDKAVKSASHPLAS